MALPFTLVTIWAEDWDEVSAPALPSNWTLFGGPIVSHASESAPTPISLPNVLTCSNTEEIGTNILTYGTPDTNGGDVVVTATAYFGGTPAGSTGIAVGAVARGNSASLGLDSIYYEAGIRHDSEVHAQDSVYLRAWSGPNSTQLDYFSGDVFSQSVWYEITFVLLGTALSVYVQDLINSEWLTPTGSWTATQTAVLSVTDSTISGAGYAGLTMTGLSGDLTYADDWTFSAIKLMIAKPVWPDFARAAARTANSAYAMIVPAPAWGLPTPPVTAFPYYEKWDEVGAPAIPAGWVSSGSPATSNSAPICVSSPNTLSSGVLVWGTPDNCNGDVTVTGTFYLANSGDDFLVARGSSAELSLDDDGVSNFYYVRVVSNGGGSPTGQVNLDVVVNGIVTGVVPAIGITWPSDGFVKVYWELTGSQHVISIQDLSSGQWLNSDSVWQSGKTAVLIGYDTTFTSSGYAGIAVLPSDGVTAFYADDWYFGPVPPQSFPAIFPDVARGPARAAYTQYAYQSRPEQFFGQSLPVPPPSRYPDRAPAPIRASNDQYTIISAQPPIPGVATPGAPLFPVFAPGPQRADATEYGGITLPALADATEPAGTPTFPATAPGPQRAAYSEYIKLNPGPGQILPPPVAPAVRPKFPDFARGPERAGPDAYRGLISRPVLPDGAQPPGTVVFPVRTTPLPWAGVTAYRGLVSARLPDGLTSSHVVAPSLAPGHARAANTSYTVIVQPHIGDRLPPAAPLFPSIARGPSLGAPSAYKAWQGSPFEAPVPTEVGATVFPDIARGPARSTADAYRGLVSRPQIGDGHQPAMPTFPVIARGPSLAPATSYTIVVAPHIGDAHQPPGTLYAPSVAPGPQRAATDAYRGLMSHPVIPDGHQPPGSVAASGPQRSPLYAPWTAYRGLVSSPAQPDLHQPSGSVLFPIRADGPVRASSAAYSRINLPPQANVYIVNVDATLAMEAFAGWGAVYTLNVSSGLGLQPYLPSAAGRYRLGDIVSLSFAPNALPTAAPTLTITEGGGGTVGSVPLWSWDGQTFQADVLLDLTFPLGTFLCSAYFVSQGGSGQLMTQQFEVVAGGDPGSSIVAVYVHEGPAERVVITQLRSGLIVSGNDPFVE